jgi:glc operon protein GlcG
MNGTSTSPLVVPDVRPAQAACSPRPAYTRAMPLTLEEAQTVIAGAHEHAAQLGVRVTVAIVDEGGLLQALGRMDGAPPLSAQIAEAKAVGAAVWHRDGSALREMQETRPAFFAQVDRMVRLPIMPGAGSALIRRADAILGAVGVSGALPDQDGECAGAGLSALSQSSGYRSSTT